MSELKRNPVIIPDKEETRRGCPKCGGMDFGGRKVQGAVYFTCRTEGCFHTWAGGQAQEPIDQRKPQAAENPLDQPAISFSKRDTGEIIEERRPVNLTQGFRMGVPMGDDNDV